MARDGPQRLRKRALKELTEIKKDILGKMRTRLRGAFDVVPTDARSLPLICLADGLTRSYHGSSIVVRRDNEGPDAPCPLSVGKNTRKRPSVVLQVEDQSFVFDGDGFKAIGNGAGEEYKGMVDEINNILKKHMKRHK